MPRLIFLLFMLFPVADAYSQDARKEIRLEREKKMQRLAKTEDISKKSSDKSGMGRLLALNSQIAQTQQLIRTIKKELGLLDEDIAQAKEVQVALTGDLKALKQEYAAMVYMASKTQGSTQKLAFLFSSETFNQLISRLQYIRQYQDNRKEQIFTIVEVQEMLKQKQDDLELEREEKTLLLKRQQSQVVRLAELKNEQKQLVAALKAQEFTLIQEKQAQDMAIREMEARVREEVKEEQRIIEPNTVIVEEEKKPANRPSKPEKTATAPTTSPDNGKPKPPATFQGTKGLMPWPVEEGFISRRFGKNPHPVLPDVWVNNLGVDIRTEKGRSAISVYNGEVTAVTRVPGVNYMVMLKHGGYYTVYAKLSKANVKVGQKVRQGQTLGVIETNQEGMTELQFQIWLDDKKLDPEHWLRPF